MAYIGKKPTDTFRGLAIKDSFTGDGSTVAFDLTREAPDGGDTDLEIFIDNVRQEGGVGKAYTLGVDGSGDNKRITFTAAPDSGAEIYIINPGRDSGFITVSDGAITEAKLHPDLDLGKTELYGFKKTNGTGSQLEDLIMTYTNGADDISVANNDGTQSDLYDESIIANQGLTFSVASNGNLTVTV